MRLKSQWMAYLLLAAAGGALGQEIDRLENLAQGEFRRLAEDLGGALSYRAQTPTTPLGLTGFDIGVGLTVARIHRSELLEAATSDSVGDTIPIPTLRLHKGLPLGIDVGLSYAAVPGSNLEYIGGELRYAIVEGGAAVPAVGVRGSFTTLRGVDELDLDTRGLDVSISKGFAGFTPYAGVGRVWVDADPKGVGLRKEDLTLDRIFVGVGINLIGLNFNLEADRTGEVEALSLKTGFRF